MEKGEGEEQSQERRLENQRHTYKFPCWKSRIAPRDLGEMFKDYGKNIKRYKNAEFGIRPTGKPNQPLAGGHLRVGRVHSHQSLGQGVSPKQAAQAPLPWQALGAGPPERMTATLSLLETKPEDGTE